MVGLESARAHESMCAAPPAQPAEGAIICMNLLAKPEFVQKGRASLLSWGEAGLDTSPVQGRGGSTVLNVQGVNECGLPHVFAKIDKQLEEAEI